MAQDTGDIREEIARDREELAGTVQALAQKADIKGRVRDSVSEGADQLQRKAGEVGQRVKELSPDSARSGLSTVSGAVRSRPLPFALAIAALVAFLAVRRVRGGD